MSKPQLEVSARYRFAKNPELALRQAVMRTIEERSDNPRKVWSALLSSTRIPPNSQALTTAMFCEALKHFGTGIQLTETDVDILFGEGKRGAIITFDVFSSFVARNH